MASRGLIRSWASRWSCIFLVPLIGVAFHGHASAQAGPPAAPDARIRPAPQTVPVLMREQVSAAIERLEQWLAAVRVHEIGTVDRHASLVAAWSTQELTEMFPLLEVLLTMVKDPLRREPLQGRFDSPLRPLRSAERALINFRIEDDHAGSLRRLAAADWIHADVNGLLYRGARLHADVAMLAPLEAAAFRPRDPARAKVIPLGMSATQRVTAEGPDGDYRGMYYGVVHWDFGRLLLRGVEPDVSHDAIARHWFRAGAAYLLHEGNFAEAKPHVDHALQLFPDDPWFLYSAGCLQAAMASPPAQEFVKLTRLPGKLQMESEPRSVHLGRAERFLRRAIEVAPDMVEARVRLAHVRLERGDADEAARVLEDALREPRDETVAYFGHLFLGHAYRALGRIEPARVAFAGAAALFPRAQSPKLALSELDRRVSRTASRTALEPLFALDGARPDDDPWWVYYEGEGRDTQALFADLDRMILERTR
jgi:tetratricopeptide (TPR) repeat protein